MKMVRIPRFFIPALVCSLAWGFPCYPQTGTTGGVIADFSMPDTVCVNTQVPIVNLSQGASSYFWKFCTGDPLTDIHGIDLGNPNNTLDEPPGIALVQDGTTFFAYNTNTNSGTITRTIWYNGLKNPPVAENLGNFGVLNPGIFGIQLKKDNGKWYGFVTNGSSLVRLNLGSSLSAEVTSATVVATSAFMNKARGLVIEKDGNEWVGFCTNFPARTITRFSWGNTLSSMPVLDDLGNIGGLTEPMQPALIRDNTGWYMFVANTTSLTQLTFGNSLLNTPTGVNLGDLNWMTDDRGMSLFVECNNAYGLITNHNVVPNLLLQLHFTGGITGTKSITPLGKVANLYEPLALSETVNIGDTIYAVALNATPSMTMLYFPPCTNSPLPSTTAFDPTPVIFTTPGTYTVKLTVDGGLPTEQTVCKVIVADGAALPDLGNDTTICEGATLILDAGAGYRQYLWNTGDTTRTLPAVTAGTYSVLVTNPGGCTAEDSIHVSLSQQLNITVDTSLCHGSKYFAGGQWQAASGTFYDSTLMQGGCYRITTTHLTIKPRIMLDIGADTCLTYGDSILLQALAPGITSVTWQDGSQDSLYTVVKPGSYWVIVMAYGCKASDTIRVTGCPNSLRFYFPNAFTPNADGLNDSFLPRGTEVVNFHMIIYDRWGRMVFESHDPSEGWNGIIKNDYAPPGAYTYVATYADPFSPASVIKSSGTFTLVR